MPDFYDYSRPRVAPQPEPTPVHRAPVRREVDPDLPWRGPRDYLRDLIHAVFHRGRQDTPFLLLSLLLLAAGLVMLLSASFASSYYESLAARGVADPSHYFRRQALFAIIGVLLMYAFSRVPLRFYRIAAEPGLVLSVILLLGVKMAGLTGGGAVRWISIGGATFQPSELVKPAMILLFAHWSCKYADRMYTARDGLLRFVAVIGLFAVLLLIQPHLSATIIICCLGVIMMIAGGTRIRYILALLAIAWVGYRFVIANEEFLVGLVSKFSYIYDRIHAWQDPKAYRQGTGWQILQSLYAIGSGGLLGQGLGQSRQKYLYLPEEHNDYIFAIICEELGFVGAVLILLLFAVLILRGFWLALHCRSRFDQLMVIGLVSLLTLQVFLNVAVVTNLLPSTGISLPFFSYGGTALVVQLAEIGLVLSASRDIENK